MWCLFCDTKRTNIIRKGIFSQLSIIHYMGLCVFSSPISLLMIEIIYTFCLIIIIKSEVWTITHYLGLGHETMVCAVCLSIFLWLIRTLTCHAMRHRQWERGLFCVLGQQIISLCFVFVFYFLFIYFFIFSFIYLLSHRSWYNRSMLINKGIFKVRRFVEMQKMHFR